MVGGGGFGTQDEARAEFLGEVVVGENLADRLTELEKSVKRAVEVIADLRRERDALQAKLAAMQADRAELQGLKQERREILSQVDGILKELDKLDL
jgi:septal ring factor EnvC (AmiA/AmiB activator)